jgi:hypothetical protein
MAVKIYSKRGNLNYKERKYIQEIQRVLDEKGISGEGFEPATTFEDLQTLYNRYCVEDANVISETKEPMEEQQPAQEKPIQNTETKETSSFIDPFNDGEVIVRDYVMDDDFKSETKQEPKKTSSFAEPKSFEEAFELPDETKARSGSSSKQTEKPKEERKPANPSFDDMSSGQKKRSTKKLAKAIVFATCKLSEFGCTWWATKDITPDKIAQYDIEQSMDLDLLLSLDENQQITVRNWFELQVKNAQELLKVSEEGKEEMTENLTAVLMEKGVALTPTQELLLSFGVHIVIDLGTKAFALQQQIKGVLNQLIAMRTETKQQQTFNEQVNETANNNSFTDESFDAEMNSTEPPSTELATI